VSDFLLTKDQKKKIEDFIETVTLRLDYTRTLDWLQRWLKASRRASIAAIFFGVITVIAAIGVVAAVVFVLWGGLPWWAITGISIVALLLWQWQWGYVIKAYETVGEPIIESLANSPSYGSLIGGYLLVIFGGGLVLVICVLLLIGVHYISQNWGFFLRIWLGLAGNFVFGMVICWIGIIIDGIATMIGAFIVFICRIVVDSARWVMWRIASYPKGPLTGTLTLIGAVLAVIKMFSSK
jgi:hypothetical protein